MVSHFLQCEPALEEYFLIFHQMFEASHETVFVDRACCPG